MEIELGNRHDDANTEYTTTRIVKRIPRSLSDEVVMGLVLLPRLLLLLPLAACLEVAV